MLIVKVVAGVLLLGVAIIGALYAFDIGVGATVEEKDCVAGQINVKTEWFGATTTLADVPANQCSTIQPGNFVKYHIRSERTSIWESEGGICIYDSEHGPGGCDK